MFFVCNDRRIHFLNEGSGPALCFFMASAATPTTGSTNVAFSSARVECSVSIFPATVSPKAATWVFVVSGTSSKAARTCWPIFYRDLRPFERCARWPRARRQAADARRSHHCRQCVHASAPDDEAKRLALYDILRRKMARGRGQPVARQYGCCQPPASSAVPQFHAIIPCDCSAPDHPRPVPTKDVSFPFFLDTGSSRFSSQSDGADRRHSASPLLDAFAGFNSYFLISPFDRKTTVGCERAVDRRVTPAAGDFPLPPPSPHHSRRDRFILELCEFREIHDRLDPVERGVSDGKIVTFSNSALAPSRGPPLGASSRDLPDGSKSHRAVFPRMRQNRNGSARKAHLPASIF